MHYLVAKLKIKEDKVKEVFKKTRTSEKNAFNFSEFYQLMDQVEKCPKVDEFGFESR